MFVPERIADLTDDRIEVSTFLSVRPEQLLETASIEQRRALVESSLLHVLSNGVDRATRLATRAVAAVDARHGDIRVRDLAASCGMSERQLERLFAEKVGVSPKLYARIRRFRSVLTQFDDPAEPTAPRLADLAAWFGYVDQSHLTRDFLAFGHELPHAE
jgi:AraC-like DNA-binding protein